MYRTYTLRLKPTGGQRRALEVMLALSCDLYNAALQERRDAWSLQRKSVSYQDQTAELTELRREDEHIRAVAVDIAREPLRRVQRAFQGFFGRIKRKQKAGFPRFRSRIRYDSLAYHNPRLKENSRLAVPSVGSVRFKSHRALAGIPKSVTIKRLRDRWIARLVCELGTAPEKCVVSSAVGIDVGVSAFATLSDGTIIENPRWTKRFEQSIARANQVLARKRRGSNNRRRAREALNRAHERAANARRNFCHHVSKWLIDNFDLVAFEKLNIKGMVRGNLAKSILDAAWGELAWQLSYKAEGAGKWAVPVNPRRTTIDCSRCREPVPKGLGDRIHLCPKCGLGLNRDHNAAINILALGVSAAGLGPSEHVLDEPGI